MKNSQAFIIEIGSTSKLHLKVFFSDSEAQTVIDLGFQSEEEDEIEIIWHGHSRDSQEQPGSQHETNLSPRLRFKDDQSASGSAAPRGRTDRGQPSRKGNNKLGFGNQRNSSPRKNLDLDHHQRQGHHQQHHGGQDHSRESSSPMVSSEVGRSPSPGSAMEVDPLSLEGFQPTPPGFQILPTENEMRFQVIEIDYDVNGDNYIRRSNANQVIPGWKSMAFQMENVFRKEEFDHRMRYISRTAGSSNGLLAWKVDLTNTDFEIEFFELLVNSTTFENGSVSWNVVSGPFKTELQQGRMNNHNFNGSKELTLKAILTGGRGAYAWQHAQLFRTKMNSNDTQFKLMIKLRRANPQSQGLQPQGCQSQGFQDPGYQPPGHQPSAPPYQPPVQVQASDNAYTR